MIKEKRFDLRQGNAAGNGPAHAVMLLTLSNHQIVGFFNPIAGISQSQQVPERITGDMCTVFFKRCLVCHSTQNRKPETTLSAAYAFCAAPSPLSLRFGNGIQNIDIGHWITNKHAYSRISGKHTRSSTAERPSIPNSRKLLQKRAQWISISFRHNFFCLS